MNVLKIVFIFLTLVLPALASAQATRTLVEGTGAVVELSRPASSIFVGDPSVADVRVVSGNTLFLAGISPGTTNVFALDFEDRLISSYQVAVVANNSEAARTLRSGVPNGSIRLSGNEGAAILRGRASSLEDALAALDARRSLEANDRIVVDRTELAGGTQVSIKVRFVEASRIDLEELGVDLTAAGTIDGGPFRILTGEGTALRGRLPAATGGIAARVGNDRGTFDALLRALDREGLVEILSEPTLTTTSGKRANFQAGGEFAIPVPQGDGVLTAEYREFGVSVDFLPVVLPNNRIAIEVSPEVSFIDDTQTPVQIDNFVAPSLSVRSAETTVEVASGQTFAIAGLYEQRESRTSQGIPGLHKSRIFGPIFGSRVNRREERELLIFITPFLTRATDVSAANRNERPNVVDTVGFIVK